jgi:hypothetical protein
MFSGLARHFHPFIAPRFIMIRAPLPSNSLPNPRSESGCSRIEKRDQDPSARIAWIAALKRSRNSSSPFRTAIPVPAPCQAVAGLYVPAAAARM